MTTVYVLTFDAQWVADGRVVRGQQSYPVTTSTGTLDATDAILACQVLAAQTGTLLFSNEGIRVDTIRGGIEMPTVWDDGTVKVY